MTALPKSDLPDELRAEMARLKRCGFALLPLGGGKDGKAPLLGNWAESSLSLSRVLGPMHRTGIAAYGVRLDKLTVIDCDTGDAELVRRIEARFGPSSVHVATPRGMHLYYRHSNLALNLRGEGLPVDVKSGPRAYVVGPLSVRPDGGTYMPVKGVLGVDHLLPLAAAPLQSGGPKAARRIERGQRHTTLVRRALKMVEYVDTAQELTDNLMAIRDDLCHDPDSLPVGEVQGVAEWAWRCRLENRVYAGRNSAFPVSRMALDLLRGHPDEPFALSLYTRLLAEHGHQPGKRFPLCHKAMKEAGLTVLSRDRFRAAVRALLSVGLLKQVGKHFAGSTPRTFALAMPFATGENVATLRWPRP